MVNLLRNKRSLGPPTQPNPNNNPYMDIEHKSKTKSQPLSDITPNINFSDMLTPRRMKSKSKSKSKSKPPKGFPLAMGSQEEASWSGENLAPDHGYSGLFASGLFKTQASPPAKPPHHFSMTTQAQTPSSKHKTKQRQYHSTHPAQLFSTPHLKRRSSIIETINTPPKQLKSETSPTNDPSLLKHKSSNSNSTAHSIHHFSSRVSVGHEFITDKHSGSTEQLDTNPRSSGIDEQLEASLDNIMTDLQRYTSANSEPENSNATTNANAKESPKSSPEKKSRWSSSSEESLETVPRKSSESVRSKMSSKLSIKSRRSEEKGRPTMEELMGVNEPVPPLPPVPALPPVTPKRLAALRRFLTPKKKQGPPPTPAPSCPLPAPPLPPPLPSITKESTSLPGQTTPKTPGSNGKTKERELNKKSSITTLRSLAKKSSTTTIRSILPSTPSRTKKSSIGPPVNRPAVSPSFFIDLMPRRAPTTPKKDSLSPSAAERTPDFGFDTPRADSVCPGSSYNTHSSNNTPTLDTPTLPSLPSENDIKIHLHNLNLNRQPNAPPTPGWTPLTAKAKVSAKVRNARNGAFANLLPRQPRYNAGIKLGNETGIESPIPFPVAIPTPARKLPDAPARSLPPPPPSFRRDPLGILDQKQDRSENVSSGSELPFRNGLGDGWSTPIVLPNPVNDKLEERENSADYFGIGTFGQQQSPLDLVRTDDSDPTFRSVSMHEGSVEESDAEAELATATISKLNISTSSRIDFTASPGPLKVFRGSYNLLEGLKENKEGEGEGEGESNAKDDDDGKGMLELKKNKDDFEFGDESEIEIDLPRPSFDSEGSSMITKEDWELESYLRSIEEREVGVGR